MPTGYTADVQEGTITEFSDFAKKCAHAFGALITLRDEPHSAIPTEFIPDTTYQDRAIAKAKNELLEVAGRSEDDWRAVMAQEYAEALRHYTESRARKAVERQRYEEMLSKVRAWEPPTSEHEGLKEFMIEQLERSIEFDCSGNWPEKPVLATDVNKYQNESYARIAKTIKYYQENRAEEIERAKSRTEWVTALLESLD